MKIDLYREDEPLWHREREVTVVPRVGEVIVFHRSASSDRFRVMHVTHVYEDRMCYRDMGDKISVTLKAVSHDEAYPTTGVDECNVK